MKIKRLNFIDIIYYNSYSFYRRYEKGLNQFSGQVLTSVCLSLNVSCIYVFFHEFFGVSFFQNKWFTLVFSIPILLFIIIRYNKYINIEDIEDSYLSFSHQKRKQLSLLSLLYIVVSVFGSIILFIILGELNNPPPFWE